MSPTKAVQNPSKTAHIQGTNLFRSAENEVTRAVRTFQESVDAAMVANIAQVSWEPETILAEVILRVNDLIETALQKQNWHALDQMLAGKFTGLDALQIPMRADIASRTNIQEVSKFQKQLEVSGWIPAYVRIALSHKDICKKYLERRPEIMDDTDSEELFDKILKMKSGNGRRPVPHGLEYTLAIKLLSEATAILETVVLEKEGEVTQDPAFVLLLTCYETLDFHGFKPSFFRKDVHPENGYADLIRAFFERFPMESYPWIYEYLAKFSIGSWKENCLSSITSRVSCVEFLEWMKLPKKTKRMKKIGWQNIFSC